jgi:hypothetical protein
MSHGQDVLHVKITVFVTLFLFKWYQPKKDINTPRGSYDLMEQLKGYLVNFIVLNTFYWYLGEQGKPCQIKVEAHAIIYTRPRRYFRLASPF